MSRQGGWQVQRPAPRYQSCVGALAAFVVVMLATAVVGCSTDQRTADDTDAPPAQDEHPISADGSGGTLRLGLVGPDTIDPEKIVPTDPNELIPVDLLFDGLTALDPETNTAVPALAASWENGPDLRSWTFTIRDDANFSDGTPVTAVDVKFSLERLAKRGDASFPGSRLEVIDGMREYARGEATDVRGVIVVTDKKLVITTREPFPQLPELLAAPSYGISSLAAFQRADLTQFPVTSGPFHVVDRDVLARSPGSKAKLDRVELVRFPGQEEAYQAFREGKVDWVIVPNGRVDEARADYGDQAMAPLPGELFFGMNLSDSRFSDVRFRQAIVKSVDRESLVRELLPGRSFMNGIVPPGIPGSVTDACGEACSYDPDAARRLLAEAFPSGQVPAVEISVEEPTSGSVPEKALADGIAAQLNEVGIPATVATRPLLEHRHLAVGGRLQLFYYGWFGMYPDPDAFLTAMFASESRDNVTGFNDPRVDAELAAARALTSREQRLERYAAIERAVLGQVPLMPLAGFRVNAVIGSSVHGFRTRVDGTFVAEDVWVG
ncbi:MAG: ABC transporter substrate-binding protein [Acidimicrobiales bacterium]|nr:ABC transporter substrate-binding protein [Acidimicrobiales bacterium]